MTSALHANRSFGNNGRTTLLQACGGDCKQLNRSFLIGIMANGLKSVVGGPLDTGTQAGQSLHGTACRGATLMLNCIASWFRTDTVAKDVRLIKLGAR
eukprot:CAMPEP_0174342802 /NCGR_PEP_ID=MMETSP0810-20121108/26436_1 /TAXON_ID=73025 ORGANISM="Eutreptiella gymnastica-like, Strain CCMP1594" /NCGR_SAMPLE_ID=MMETSP0810 /ASSEMBLY_ACC=CAM_ASM_000659 /LENGTH=97 /DNA_ID=CAMNT_0015465123 /DNA_START=137 /DNA_END=426 /DNA_ORIENTATION=-